MSVWKAKLPGEPATSTVSAPALSGLKQPELRDDAVARLQHRAALRPDTVMTAADVIAVLPWQEGEVRKWLAANVTAVGSPFGEPVYLWQAVVLAMTDVPVAPVTMGTTAEPQVITVETTTPLPTNASTGLPVQIPAGQWMNAAEAAEYLRMSGPRALYQQVRRGTVPCVRSGKRSMRFKKSDLDAALERGARRS